MTTLQIVFNCLCLFVRDEAEGLVHVLMPSTAGGHHPRHLVLLQHPSFTGPLPLRDLEGWALVLGPSAGRATPARIDTLLAPRQSGEILDLTAATVDSAHPNGRRVKRALVTGRNPAVASRITLRTGGVRDVASETAWIFKNTIVRMTTKVLWEMEIDDENAPLDWQPIGARGSRPLDTLAALGAEEPLLEQFDPATGKFAPGNRKGYVLQVFHATLGTLRADEVTKHFRIFYEKGLEHTPTIDQLPRNDQEGPEVNCGGSQAAME